MNIRVPKIFKPLYQDTARYKGLSGGRGSGKSWAIADYILFKMVQDPGLNTVCLREIQKSIAKSSKKLIEDRIEFYGLSDYFEILNTEIKSKKGKGFIIFQGLQDHTSESIKSLEGISIAWVEESQTITEFSLDLLVPTIRKEDSELLFSWNPRYDTDPIGAFFANKTNAIKIHSTYKDNKFCPDVIIQEAEEMELKNPMKYRHIYLGEILEDDDLAIIPRKWLNACVDAHIKLDIEATGKKRIGYDVADSGEDKNAAIFAHGVLAYNAVQWDGGKDKMFTSSKRVHNMAVADEISEVNYDNVGVGAGVGSNFNEIGSRFPHFGFSAGAKPKDPKGYYKDKKRNEDAFKNLKAQAWQAVADRFMDTYNRIENNIPCPDDHIISLSSAMPLLDELITELSTPRADEDGVGRFMVESKANLAKRGIKSPNLADAFIMAMFDISVRRQSGAMLNDIEFI